MKKYNFPILSEIRHLPPKDIAKTFREAGFKFPKDTYNIFKYKTNKDEHINELMYVVGKKYALAILKDELYVLKIVSNPDQSCFSNIIRERELFKKHFAFHNDLGPSYFSLAGDFNYYINGKKLTKQQFIAYRTNQRIKLING